MGSDTAQLHQHGRNLVRPGKTKGFAIGGSAVGFNMRASQHTTIADRRSHVAWSVADWATHPKIARCQEVNKTLTGRNIGPTTVEDLLKKVEDREEKARKVKGKRVQGSQEREMEKATRARRRKGLQKQ